MDTSQAAQKSPALTDMIGHLPRYRLTCHDFERMVDAGILHAEDRVELWDGQLILMSPINAPHEVIVRRLNELFHRLKPLHAKVGVQGPVTLGPHNVRYPDISLVDGNHQGYGHVHAGPKDIYILVEVADSSHKFDVTTKARMYAEAGIREYWIVSAATKSVTVYRVPRDGRYQSVSAPHTRDDSLSVEAFPGMTFPVSDVFA